MKYMSGFVLHSFAFANTFGSMIRVIYSLRTPSITIKAKTFHELESHDFLEDIKLVIFDGNDGLPRS